MRNNKLVVAVAALVGGSGISTKALVDSVMTIKAANDVFLDVLPPMPPEVARKAERDQWKLARKRGK